MPEMRMHISQVKFRKLHQSQNSWQVCKSLNEGNS